MANMSQRLRHGKALCGKVFSGFVETFNALVDFKDNLKGDDDVAPGANGHLHLDRTDPKHPVLRCRGCGGTSGQVQATITLPWTFRCTVTNQGTADETRTGGWYNGQIQLGLGFIGRQDGTLSTAFTGYGQTADGDYYLEVKPSLNAVEIKRYAHQQVPSNDIANDTYYVYVGTVENAVQTDGIYCVPVVYKYL